jgi:hypothetical protein
VWKLHKTVDEAAVQMYEHTYMTQILPPEIFFAASGDSRQEGAARLVLTFPPIR